MVFTKQKIHEQTQPLVNHSGLIIAFLTLLYIGSAIGAIAFYMQTRCPYASLTACEAANELKCGDPTVGDSDDCARFVNNAEPCYCSACRYCLTKAQFDHCERSADDRLQQCRTAMSIESSYNTKAP